VKTTDLAIVGAGPGGLAAAAEAIRHSMSVTLLDDNPSSGGQYFRRTPAAFRKIGRSFFDNDETKAGALLQVTDHPSVSYLPNSTVWDFPDTHVLAFARGADSARLHAECIIVSPGAFDRPVPFPGWTLPGVIAAGGVQNLLKSQRVLPGRRVLVAGNGPLLLLLARNLHHAGARVLEVLETAPLYRRVWRELPRLLADPAMLCRGLGYRASLLRAGIPVRTGETVLEAHGKDEVTEAVVAPIDPAGRLDRSQARSIQLDTLVIGFGFTPSVELTRLLGCAHRYDPLRGGWVPVRSSDLETSVAGVFVVGEGAGIAGVEVAMTEGRLAGLAAAVRLGRCHPADAVRIARPLRGRLARLSRFRQGLDRLYASPDTYLGLLTPETVVCRCEDVTAERVFHLLAERVHSLNALKALTRSTMGRCQGRNCLGTLAALVARELVCAPADLVLPSPRPPARPIPLEDLLQDSSEESGEAALVAWDEVADRTHS
jgi:NADPH-dependent 2,4-dienoyl-CoA reductase/sulfur reductase-like enzyme